MNHSLQSGSHGMDSVIAMVFGYCGDDFQMIDG